LLFSANHTDDQIVFPVIAGIGMLTLADTKQEFSTRHLGALLSGKAVIIDLETSQGDALLGLLTIQVPARNPGPYDRVITHVDLDCTARLAIEYGNWSVKEKGRAGW
jgi:hypothetical protein